MQDANNRGNWSGIGECGSGCARRGNKQKLYVLSTQFFSKPKSALRNETYLFKKQRQKILPPTSLYISLWFCVSLPKINVKIYGEENFESWLWSEMAQTKMPWEIQVEFLSVQIITYVTLACPFNFIVEQGWWSWNVHLSFPEANQSIDDQIDI